MRLGKEVAIGLTSDSMLELTPKGQVVQPYEKRYRELEDFLRAERSIERCSIFPIDTVEGGADVMKDLEALVVSDEISVVQNAFDINEKRTRNKLSRFHIVVVPRVRTPDGRPLSSSRIREGEKFDSASLVY